MFPQKRLVIIPIPGTFTYPKKDRCLISARARPSPRDTEAHSRNLLIYVKAEILR